MSKFWVILKREYAQVVKKKSFLIMTLLTPVLMAGMMSIPSLLMSQGTAETESYAIIDRDGRQLGEQVVEAMTTYTLDDAGTPAYEIDGIEVVGSTEESRFEATYEVLIQKIRDHELDHLLVLNGNADLADSNLLLITNLDAPRISRRFEYQLSQLLAERRIEESGIGITPDSLLSLTHRVSLPKQDTKGESIDPRIKLLSAMVLIMMIYLLILIDGGTLMRSIIEEKTSRIVEVLMSSASPFQLMAGKIIGTGLAAMTQVGIWIVAGAGLMAFLPSSGSNVETAIISTIANPATVVCFASFLLLGYLMYSTIFALIGSVVNSDKEAQSMMMPVILVLFLPSVMIAPAVLELSNAGWIKVVSFIPTYTPLVMMMRVAIAAPMVEGNPLLSGIMAEAVIGMLGMIITTVIFVWITARVFRVGILMYGKRPTLPEIIRWVRY